MTKTLLRNIAYLATFDDLQREITDGAVLMDGMTADAAAGHRWTNYQQLQCPKSEPSRGSPKWKMSGANMMHTHNMRGRQSGWKTSSSVAYMGVTVTSDRQVAFVEQG
jgi:hypothetical protein